LIGDNTLAAIVKSNKQSYAVILVLLIFIAVYFAFFPAFYSSSDEHHNIANALLIQKGLIAEKDPTNVCNAGLYTSNGYVYGQYIGRALFLIPFTWFGLSAVILSSLIIHLVNFALLLLILNKMKVDKVFALPYLFYPVIFWQSRAIYADILVLTAFLGAFYFLLSEKRKCLVVSGLFMGLAMLSRYDAALGIGAILAALLLKDRKRFLFVLSGFLPVFFAIFLFNNFEYGSVVATGYGDSGLSLLYSTIFGAQPISILFYIAFLLLLYPLMLASPYLAKRFPFKLEFAFFSLAYIFLAARYNPFHFELSLLTLPLRMRYALPLAGMLLIPYAVFLQEIIEKYKAKRGIILGAYWIAIAVLFIGSTFAAYVHSNFLKERKEVFEILYEKTPEDALIIGSSDDCMYFLNGFFPKRRYLNVDLNQGLAGNPQGLSIEQFIDSKTYVIDLEYSSRFGRQDMRYQTIANERAKIKEFIEKNKEGLELVYDENKKFYLRIYKILR